MTDINLTDLPDIEDGKIIIARRNGGELDGYVLARWDAGEGHLVLIDGLSEEDMEDLHTIVHQIRDRDVEPAAAEKGEQTEEDKQWSDIWQAQSAAAEIDRLQAARREVRLGVKKSEIDASREVMDSHPLVLAIDKRIDEIRESIVILVDLS